MNSSSRSPHRRTNRGDQPGVLIIVENLGVPFDRRVWMEATTLRDEGYRVSVICPAMMGASPGYEELDGIHVYRHPLREAAGSARGYLREYASALYWEARLACRVWREQGFDVVHICNPPDLLFLVAGWFKFWGVKVVFDHHDLNPELYLDKYGKKDLFYRGLLLAEKFTFRTADAVISTNESFRNVALRRGGKRPDEVTVVRSAPDLEKFQRRAGNQELKRGRRHLVGYVGVMGEQDGLDLLLRSAAIVVHEHERDVQFMLIGGGPALRDLKELSQELGLEGHVEFAGFQQGDELLTSLSTFDVGASPDPSTSFNDMCTMNKVLEYMALEIPVVQFDLTEGRESAGEASLYAQANDPQDFAAKLIHLLDDPELRQSLGRVGKQRMQEQLAWHHQRRRLLAVYDRLTGASVDGGVTSERLGS